MSDTKMNTGENFRDWFTRRQAVKTGAAIGVGAAFLTRFGKLRRAHAAKNDEIRIGLVGCGGRGTGAAGDAIKADPGARLVAMGDLFPDRLNSAREQLSGSEDAARLKIENDRAFSGFDAFEKVIASDVDYVILATPPGFRPAHYAAAIAAGKHVFMEKPIAVDGPGIRSVLATTTEAENKKLAVGVGLQRRHHAGYLELMKQIKKGAIGKVVAARSYWMQGSLWMKPREKNWTDMEWQIRNWLYFAWLSGDHICEQHIHNIDVMNWAIGKPPVAAVAMGGRQQRVDPAYGHIYDHFAVDFEYPDGVHALSMCRQIPRCENSVSEYFTGTAGNAHADNRDFAVNGKKAWKFTGEAKPYVQEHIDLIASIRSGKPLNEAKQAADSNLAAIMGRMAAYTGERVTYQQALDSKENLAPAKLAFGKVDLPPVAIPGKNRVI